ncbi:MAG: hypothetical protein ACHQHN_05845 [Sphingobacteriales bacterium]
MNLFKIILVSLALITLITGCQLPIVTKGQTINAIIGKWENKELGKSGIKTITFTKIKDASGDSLLFIEYQKNSKGIKRDTDIWHYAGVRKIEMSPEGKPYTLHFTLINYHKMELEMGDLYIKDN